MVDSHSIEKSPFDYRLFGYQQIGWTRYALLCIAVLAQLATLLITWELWEVRTTPPNLPVVPWPQFGVSVLMLVSLIGVLIDPLRGFVLHLGLMVFACLMDQYRMQPQFLANAALMLATLGLRGQFVCYWFLAAMWFWAGLHKLLSPDWFTHGSYRLLAKANFGRDESLAMQHSFATIVAMSEMGLGIVALLRVRLAAIGCLALHLGIVAMLIVINWNFSVIPWNLGTAIVGFWVLWTFRDRDESGKPQSKRFPAFQTVVASALFVLPIGFYFGVFDHGYANVLYSDSLPRGLITSPDKLEKIRGWDAIHVPFPSERRLLRQYFECVASSGDKLHIRDPRQALDDQFFILDGDGRAEEITSKQFFSASADELAGFGIDDRYSSFHLRQWGTITQRYYQGDDSSAQNLVSTAYTFDPDHFQRDRLRLLAGLPNLRELDLTGCNVEDDELKIVGQLQRLTWISLNGTGVTDEGLKHLAPIGGLKVLETENTRVSPNGLKMLNEALFPREQSDEKAAN